MRYLSDKNCESYFRPKTPKILHGFGASEEDPRRSRRGLPERDRERENLRAAGDAFRGVGDREAERLGDRRRRRLPAAGEGERSTDRTIVVELKQIRKMSN